MTGNVFISFKKHKPITDVSSSIVETASQADWETRLTEQELSVQGTRLDSGLAPSEQLGSTLDGYKVGV